jgi:hypothetical protein
MAGRRRRHRKPSKSHKHTVGHGAHGAGGYCVMKRFANGSASTTCYRTHGKAGSAAGRAALKPAGRRHGSDVVTVMIYLRGKKRKSRR